MNSCDTKDRRLGLKLSFMAIAMFGFGFLLVPLYDVFCELTGAGGRMDTVAAQLTGAEAPQERRITVEFVASVNQQAPWNFRPAVDSMEVHPGGLYETTFFARNLTARPLVAQAVPSIAPGQANRYFRKTECFCFTEQPFEPQEGRDMPLVFMVDPELPAHIDRRTLSYTFFSKKAVALTH